MWKGHMTFYKPNVLYTSAIHNLTVNGVTNITFILEENTHILLSCHVDGNPVSEIQLYNGPYLLIRKSDDKEPISLHTSHYMTCNSFNTFTCVAIQPHTKVNRSVELYTECPIRLKQLIANVTTQLESHIGSLVAILIDIYGYPKPIYYGIIKSNATEISFDVTGWNAFATGYEVSYQEDT
ncbi:unnamed protein product, partial [Lymnaea stagnalis]